MENRKSNIGEVSFSIEYEICPSIFCVLPLVCPDLSSLKLIQDGDECDHQGSHSRTSSIGKRELFLVSLRAREAFPETVPEYFYVSDKSATGEGNRLAWLACMTSSEHRTTRQRGLYTKGTWQGERKWLLRKEPRVSLWLEYFLEIQPELSL